MLTTFPSFSIIHHHSIRTCSFHVHYLPLPPTPEPTLCAYSPDTTPSSVDIYCIWSFAWLSAKVKPAYNWQLRKRVEKNSRILVYETYSPPIESCSKPAFLRSLNILLTWSLLHSLFWCSVGEQVTFIKWRSLSISVWAFHSSEMMRGATLCIFHYYMTSLTIQPWEFWSL